MCQYGVCSHESLIIYRIPFGLTFNPVCRLKLLVTYQMLYRHPKTEQQRDFWLLRELLRSNCSDRTAANYSSFFPLDVSSKFFPKEHGGWQGLVFSSEAAGEGLCAMDSSPPHKQWMWFSLGFSKGPWKEQVGKGQHSILSPVQDLATFSNIFEPVRSWKCSPGLSTHSCLPP